MPMRIKNTEWILFKERFMSLLELLGNETDKFELPEETENFEIYVDECEVMPIFSKKQDYLKIEYDFTLCETKLRTLSFSMYKGAARIEMTLKDDTNQKDSDNIVWQENHF
jgi:hypothetical protein